MHSQLTNYNVLKTNLSDSEKISMLLNQRRNASSGTIM